MTTSKASFKPEKEWRREAPPFFLIVAQSATTKARF